MKSRIRPFLAAAALLLPAAFSTPSAQAEVSFEIFHENLAPYGDWVQVNDYGYCWRPTQVGAGWRPYSRGQWAWTDRGWCWVSDEAWGWATYHYGRWTFLQGYGWLWVPGYTWAPAWVSWRESDSHIGWAPLPPAVAWRPSTGIRFGISFGFGNYYDCGPDYYSFVPVRNFCSPRVWNHVAPVSRNTTIIQETTNITNIVNVQNNNNTFIYNRGPAYTRVARDSANPVARYRLQQQGADVLRGTRDPRPRARDGVLRVAAPAVSAPRRGREPRPANVRGRIARATEDDGFASVRDRTQRERIAGLYRDQARAVSRSGDRMPARLAAPGDATARAVRERVNPARDRSIGRGNRVPAPRALNEPQRRGPSDAARANASRNPGVRPARGQQQAVPDSNAVAARPRTTGRRSTPDAPRRIRPTRNVSPNADRNDARRLTVRPATRPAPQPTLQRPSSQPRRVQPAAPVISRQRPEPVERERRSVRTPRRATPRQTIQRPANRPQRVQPSPRAVPQQRLRPQRREQPAVRRQSRPAPAQTIRRPTNQTQRVRPTQTTPVQRDNARRAAPRRPQRVQQAPQRRPQPSQGIRPSDGRKRR